MEMYYVYMCINFFFLLIVEQLYILKFSIYILLQVQSVLSSFPFVREKYLLLKKYANKIFIIRYYM